MGGPPTPRDVEHALEAVKALDPGIVMLYGSWARGTATPESDIDLYLVFDDLGDYSKRREMEARAQDAVQAATPRRADVRATDRPEWAALSGCVSTFERHVADHAVVLWERPPRTVRWDKPMERPASDAECARRMLGKVHDRITYLLINEPGLRLSDASGDPQEIRHGFALVCLQAMDVMNCSLVALAHALPCPRIREMTLDVVDSIKVMPLRSKEREQLLSALGPVASSDVAIWHRSGTNPEVREQEWVLQAATPRHADQMAQAAYRLAHRALHMIEKRIGSDKESQGLREFFGNLD